MASDGLRRHYFTEPSPGTKILYLMVALKGDVTSLLRDAEKRLRIIVTIGALKNGGTDLFTLFPRIRPVIVNLTFLFIIQSDWEKVKSSS